jgi:PAS domain S-box-containing protein
MGIDAAALFASIELSPIATILTGPNDADCPIVAVNAAFLTLTGYAAEEVLGRNCRLLGGAETSPLARAELRRALEAGEPTLVEIRNYRRDGSSFVNAVMIAPVRDDDGSITFFIGSQMDLGRGDEAAASRHARAREQFGALTSRQREVLHGMVHGQRNKQIARTLGIEEKTVKMHRAALLARLGVASSAEAIRIGLESELI